MENEVVTLLTYVGEIVGRLKEETDTSYMIEDARLFVQTPDGAGFAPGCSMTGENANETVFNKNTVLAIVKSNEQATAGWRQQTSGIVT